MEEQILKIIHKHGSSDWTLMSKEITDHIFEFLIYMYQDERGTRKQLEASYDYWLKEWKSIHHGKTDKKNTKGKN